MKPDIEELERRDVPSATFTTQYPYGAVEQYPIAPAGMEVVALQDEINAAPLLPGGSYWHPTPLMPVPQWAAGNFMTFFSQLPVWQQTQWTVPQPGGDAFAFEPKAEWLNAQNALYGVGWQVDGRWGQWLANEQQAMQQADQQLFATQDAYWAAQAPVSQPNIVNPLAQPGDALIVAALLQQQKS